MGDTQSFLEVRFKGTQSVSLVNLVDISYVAYSPGDGIRVFQRGVKEAIFVPGVTYEELRGMVLTANFGSGVEVADAVKMVEVPG